MRTPLHPQGFVEPCLPTPSKTPRSGPEWVHEIKYDGYRLMARRNGDRARLFTRRGNDWTSRYPRILEALRTLKVRSATIDGEAVWCGSDGNSDFDKLHSRAHDDQVFLYAFDLLELNGEDYRALPLEKRKDKLARLLVRTEGMRFSDTWKATALDVRARLQAGPRRHCEQAARSALRFRPVEELDQGSESGERGDAAVRRGDVLSLRVLLSRKR